MRIITSLLTAVLLALVMARPSPAQALVPIEVSGGYQMQQFDSTLLESGWYGDAAIPLNGHSAVVLEAARSFDSYGRSFDSPIGRSEVRGSLRMFSGLGGVRFTVRPHRRVSAYAQLLAGVTQFRVALDYSIDVDVTFLDPLGIPLPRVSGFSESLTRNFATVRGGGGIVVGLSDRLGARGHVDFGGYFGDQSPPAGPRLTLGLVARF
jgi:hypothetical protein